jgi:uncharacterized secreted protein with C-terminal beta-propeller domain
MSRSTLPLLVLGLLILAAVIAGGCMGSAVAPAAGDIRKFGSTDEIREYLQNNTALAGENGYGESWAATDMAVAPRAAAAESVAKGVAVPAAIGGSADHSTTNVQVAGVDEPDFVKNDGRYIYVITGQTLAIVDAYPAASASVVSKTGIADTPKDLFIDGDRLVLFTTGTEETDTT